MERLPDENEFNVDAVINGILERHQDVEDEEDQETVEFYETTLASMVDLQRLATTIGFQTPEVYKIDEYTTAERYRFLNETIAWRGDDDTVPVDIQVAAFALSTLINLKSDIDSQGVDGDTIELRDDTVGDIITSGLLDEDQKTAYVALVNTYLQDVMEPLVITAEFVESFEDKQEVIEANQLIRQQLRVAATMTLRIMIGERDQINKIAFALVCKAAKTYPEFLEQLAKRAEKSVDDTLSDGGLAEDDDGDEEECEVLASLAGSCEEIGLDPETQEVIIANMHRVMYEAGFRTDLSY
jgi:hypothetical protein